MQLGTINVKGLLDAVNVDTLVKYMLQEIEHTWRVKFVEIKNTEKVDAVD